ncbi:ATP-NAD kinase family protein [Promethearchaeum syntrophicum]|uniref:ATP-NAD kinase family protein n=1 Tax=Promethearchaeum syntrophicum TaxID=2594042 RepID=A0A5B9D9G3_9ARCH|nr:ATP-NAD kinase family protein [Candidatus Prometheoarchaeum syntrophicum]QEE15370.1 ATP-NAD kinase [Candidatus Prometheoarchaeum syntrophicum]
MFKIGLIVNPIAGIGGTVGLKGSDGLEILNQARERGGLIQAPKRTEEFLIELKAIIDDIKIYTLKGVMGGDIAIKEGFKTEFLMIEGIPTSTNLFETNPSFTIETAKKMKDLKMDLIIFVGGDGTARDIFESVGSEIPCLGIPSGVKINSSVFAVNPKAAAKLLIEFYNGHAHLRESEVLDIDESAFRDNRVVSKFYGYLSTPYLPTLSQPSKMASPQTLEEKNNQLRIADWIVKQMDNSGIDYYYLLGPGTTVRAIAEVLDQDKTLLGVDLFHKKKCIAMDLNEQQIIKNIENRKVKLVVTPIGAQGFVFGRGNLQLSPKILMKIGLENIIIIATKYKISSLPNGKLRIDSRDSTFDEKFTGLHRVLADFGEINIIEVK